MQKGQDDEKIIEENDLFGDGISVPNSPSPEDEVGVGELGDVDESLPAPTEESLPVGEDEEEW